VSYFNRFGGKEEWMTFMNEFVVMEFQNMRDFLEHVSVSSKPKFYTCIRLFVHM